MYQIFQALEKKTLPRNELEAGFFFGIWIFSLVVEVTEMSDNVPVCTL